MNINDILNSIKDDALKDIKHEFKSLFKEALKDRIDFVQQSARQLEQAMIYLRQGLLTNSDVATLLKKQKKIAQIHANTSAIAARVRIQKLVYRLFDIAIDILLKAIVPV